MGSDGALTFPWRTPNYLPRPARSSRLWNQSLLASETQAVQLPSHVRLFPCLDANHVASEPTNPAPAGDTDQGRDYPVTLRQIPSPSIVNTPIIGSSG